MLSNELKYCFNIFQGVCRELCGLKASIDRDLLRKGRPISQQPVTDPGPNNRPDYIYLLQVDFSSLTYDHCDSCTPPCRSHSHHQSIPSDHVRRPPDHNNYPALRSAISAAQLLQFLPTYPCHFEFCSKPGASAYTTTSFIVHIPVYWFRSLAFLFPGPSPVDISYRLTSYLSHLTEVSLDCSEVEIMMEVDHMDSTFDSTLDCTMSAPSTPGGSPPLAIPQKITTTSTPTSSMSGSPPRVRVLKPNGISSPTTPKRRRITTESSVSGCDSPLNVSVDTVSLLSAEDSSMYSDGNQSMSPCSSPSAFRSACAKADFRGKYKKDELWASIRSDYHYIMDKEIIETCKVRVVT